MTDFTTISRKLDDLTSQVMSHGREIEDLSKKTAILLLELEPVTPNIDYSYIEDRNARELLTLNNMLMVKSRKPARFLEYSRHAYLQLEIAIDCFFMKSDVLQIARMLHAYMEMCERNAGRIKSSRFRKLVPLFTDDTQQEELIVVMEKAVSYFRDHPDDVTKLRSIDAFRKQVKRTDQTTKRRCSFREVFGWTAESDTRHGSQDSTKRFPVQSSVNVDVKDNYWLMENMNDFRNLASHGECSAVELRERLKANPELNRKLHYLLRHIDTPLRYFDNVEIFISDFIRELVARCKC